MHKDLLQKEFTIEINFFRGSKSEVANAFRLKKIKFAQSRLIKFTYLEGTIRELLAMQASFADPSVNAMDWLFEFLSKNCVRGDKITREEFLQLNGEQIQKLYRRILDTYGGGFYKAKDEDEEKEQDDEKTEPSRLVTAATVTLVMEKTGISLEEYLNLTYSQFKFLQDGILYNLRAVTKEGANRNRSAILMEQSRGSMDDKQAKAATRELWEKMLERREEKKRASNL